MRIMAILKISYLYSILTAIILLSYPVYATPYLYSNKTVVEAPILYEHNPYFIALNSTPFPPDYYVYYFGSGGSNPFNPVKNITGFYIRIKKYGTPINNFAWTLYKYNYVTNPIWSNLISVDSGSYSKDSIVDFNSTGTGGISIPFPNTYNNTGGIGFAISFSCSQCNATDTYYIIGSDVVNYFYDFNNSAYFTSIDKITGYTAPNETAILKTDGFYLNNMFISIEGNYNYPILPPPTPSPTPTPTPTPNPTPTVFPTNGTPFYTPVPNPTAGVIPTSTVIPNNIGDIITNINYLSNKTVKNMTYTVTNISQILSTYNNTNSSNILSYFVPAVITAIPEKLWFVGLLSWIFCAILMFLKR